MSIKVQNLTFSYGDKETLHNVEFSSEDGDLTAVLGPNGAGKSTFFKCILGFLKANTGKILLNGKDMKTLTRAEIAKEIAYIPQSITPTFNYTVLDTVLMGTTNSLKAFESPSAAQKAHAVEILDSLGIAHLSYRGCGNISGGERQLVLLARALIQNAKILLMDEPTANLDYGNQYKVMKRISALAKQDYTVIFSTHDPNQALLHATRIFVLRNGSTVINGAPEQVLTEAKLSELYGIDISLKKVKLCDSETLVCLPVN